MATLKLRTEGKWTAGFYFTNALFRTSGVYHRVLKILSGKEGQRNILGDVRSTVQNLYQQRRGSLWEHGHVNQVHKEVVELKHISDGIREGRTVPFATATEAVEELLNLIETLK
jgi:hypothetical protein